MVGFEKIKDTYEAYPNFGYIYIVLKDSLTHEINGFLLQDGYLFRSRKLCIPRTSLREFLVWELRDAGLLDIFGETKQLKLWTSFLLAKLKERCCKVCWSMSHMSTRQVTETKH